MEPENYITDHPLFTHHPLCESHTHPPPPLLSMNALISRLGRVSLSAAPRLATSTATTTSAFTSALPSLSTFTTHRLFSTPPSSDTSYRDIALSENEITRIDHDGSTKRIRRKKREADAPINKNVADMSVSRFSDEETARLLEEAYAAKPERLGPQNYNQKRRMKQKWRIVHAAHAVTKSQKLAAHYRTMEKRSRIAKENKAMQARCLELYPDHPNNARLLAKSNGSSKEQWGKGGE